MLKNELRQFPSALMSKNNNTREIILLLRLSLLSENITQIVSEDERRTFQIYRCGKSFRRKKTKQ